jgi:hypothetical protein
MKTSPFTYKELMDKFHVSRNEVRRVLVNDFDITPEYQFCLCYYHRLNCTGQKFQGHLNRGVFYYVDPRNDTKDAEFVIIYHGCTPTEVRNAQEVKISLRIALQEFNLDNYAIVSVVRYKNGDTQAPKKQHIEFNQPKERVRS